MAFEKIAVITPACLFDGREQIFFVEPLVFQIALDDGQDIGGSKQITYPNYASADTPLSQMYGDNVPKLRHIQETWDPDNVMYLAGGFKF